MSRRYGKGRRSLSIGAAAGGVLLAAAAGAQGDAALEVNVADCVAIESPAERFRCYESRVDAALREQVGATVSAESVGAADAEPAGVASASSLDSAAEPAAAAPVREIELDNAAATADEFGLRRPRAASESQGDVEEMRGTIAALRQTVPNSFINTLENGQVWRQMRPQWYPLQVGHNVRIYPTRWGNSYRMSSVELNGFIQVERVQ